MIVILGLLAACTTTPPPPAPGQALPAVARVTPLILSVSDLAPGKPVGLSVVGPPGANVGIVSGSPGGPECPAGFFGACFDLAGAAIVGTVRTDSSGAGRVETTLPAGTPVGGEVVFQAMVVDGGIVTSVSEAVSRTVLDAAAWIAPPRTNVLVILIDDVGVDRFALYGAQAPATTPTIDALAADGLVFENFWAMPLCGPSRAALLTGRLPRRTGYGTNQSVEADDTELDPDLTTIAELVDYSPWYDYQSSFVGKWHLASPFSPSGTLAPKVQGWDWWTGFVSGVDHWFGANPGGVPPSYFHFQLVNNKGRFVPTDRYATTTTVDDAIDRIDTMSEPWLLQVSFNAAHEPFHVPPPPLHTNAALTAQSPPADLHRAMLEAMDTELGRLLGSIPAKVLDNTMIFFLADNGTVRLAAEGAEDKTRMKASLFDGGVRVPFVVSGPLVTAPGRTQSFGHITDLFPTIAEIAGVDLSKLRAALDPEQPLVIDGVSLVPTLRDPTVTVRDTLYAEKFSPGGGGPFLSDTRAIRDDRYKLMLQMPCDEETFYEYVAGAWDEGEDLIPGGLTPEQDAARMHLRETMDSLVAGLVYDADSWPLPVYRPPLPCDGDTGDTGVPADTGAVVQPVDRNDTAAP
jgi:arylsulfatase A-like enzyme